MNFIAKLKTLIFKPAKCQRCEELLDFIEKLYELSAISHIDCGRDRLYDLLKKHGRK